MQCCVGARRAIRRPRPACHFEIQPVSCRGSSPRPCNTPAPAARCPRVRRAHPWAQSLIRFALPTARVSFGSNWEGPAPAAALPVNLQQRKYLGTRRHRGQCQVLTIPPRSGALRVLGNRWVPKVDTLFKPFWEKAPTEVRAGGGAIQDPVRFVFAQGSSSSSSCTPLNTRRRFSDGCDHTHRLVRRDI